MSTEQSTSIRLSTSNLPVCTYQLSNQLSKESIYRSTNQPTNQPNTFMSSTTSFKQPSIVNHQPSTINHQPPTTNHQLPSTNHQPPTTNHQPLTTNHQRRCSGLQGPSLPHQCTRLQATAAALCRSDGRTFALVRAKACVARVCGEPCVSAPAQKNCTVRFEATTSGVIVRTIARFNAGPETIRKR
jgi:hypothetical protein